LVLWFDCDYSGIFGNHQMRKFRKDYIVYKGEEMIFSGNREECAKFLGIKERSLVHKVWRSKKEPKGERYTVFTMDMEEMDND
jgi:hypothetical protein